MIIHCVEYLGEQVTILGNYCIYKDNFYSSYLLRNVLQQRCMGRPLGRLFSQSKMAVEMAKQGDSFTLQQVEEILASGDENARVLLALNGLALDSLLTDKSARVRSIVAGYGYAHEMLHQDPDENVRAAVADSGGFLDVLLHDKSAMVRASVAEKRYGLDFLIHDEDVEVRRIAQKRMPCV